jgi:methionine-rich copper-binding protein CopC
MMRYRVFIGLLVALLAIMPAARVSAHANLERSEPPAGATVESTPREIVLAFSERLDPGFTSVRLVDSASREIDPGPGTIDPADPRVLKLALGELPRGAYTALWRVCSADDGHVTQGSVPFGVGIAVAITALIPPRGAGGASASEEELLREGLREGLPPLKTTSSTPSIAASSACAYDVRNEERP